MSSKLSIDEQIANQEQRTKEAQNKLKELKKKKQKIMRERTLKEFEKQRETLIEKAKQYDFIEAILINENGSRGWYKFVDEYKKATGAEPKLFGDSQPKPKAVTEVVQTVEEPRPMRIDDILESVSSNH